ncbi:uncharacterized protein [Battus philenor]|uniref:uncharacterized protein isoform X2 n=1 Tax=Battus philenor TaxID=42288 RepID=UPI0035CF03F6
MRMPANNLKTLSCPDETHTKEQVLDEQKEERFRVSVILERYFSDERARAYVSVPRRRPVRWLRQRLRALFGLRGAFCLCSRGHLLPPDEPLSLLQPDDPVQVIPLQHDTTELDEINSSFANAEKCQYRVTISPNPSPELRPASTATLEVNKDEELLQMKKKALALLDTCDSAFSISEKDTLGAQSAAVDSDRPRKARRRTRRRKRCFSGEEANAAEVHDQKVTDKEKEDVIDSSVSIAQSGTCPNLVIKASGENMAEGDVGCAEGGRIEPRRARLVHSLSP